MPDEDKFSVTAPFYLYDLNLLVIFITSFYSIVYNRLKSKFPDSKFASWVSAFCLASEHSRAGDHSLRDEIVKIMAEYGISQDDWENLQTIRKLRNELCHPRVGINRVFSILNQRWRTHPSFESLRQMLRVVRTHTDTPLSSSASASPRTRRTFASTLRDSTDSKSDNCSTDSTKNKSESTSNDAP